MAPVLCINNTIKKVCPKKQSHKDCLLFECREGADVNGYFMWALMDCMEVGSSYQVRFGLAYTDYPNNLERILKKSAKWFKDVFLAS